MELEEILLFFVEEEFQDEVVFIAVQKDVPDYGV